MSQNINNMKSTFTTGLDNISSRVLIDLQYLTTPLLTHIFNLTIIKKNYPQALKNLKVIPILKKDKVPSNPENYRDINLSNSIAKKLDKEYYDQISENHMRGISGLFTIDAIENIHKNLTKSRIENIPSILISIDQSSAFPMISHDIL